MGQNSDDDWTASIYVLVQLTQITHCLNVLSGQVEPDAEEYSYQFSVKIIGLPEISSKETAPEQDLFASNSFRKWELKYPFLTPIQYIAYQQGAVSRYLLSF